MSDLGALTPIAAFLAAFITCESNGGMPNLVHGNAPGSIQGLRLSVIAFVTTVAIMFALYAICSSVLSKGDSPPRNNTDKPK